MDSRGSFKGYLCESITNWDQIGYEIIIYTQKNIPLYIIENRISNLIAILSLLDYESAVIKVCDSDGTPHTQLQERIIRQGQLYPQVEQQ